jgi:hypothetical protein
MSLFYIKKIFFVVLLMLLFLEIFSQVVFYWSTGHFLCLQKNPPPVRDFPKTEEYQLGFNLHPYFGWANPVGVPVTRLPFKAEKFLYPLTSQQVDWLTLKANNLGFISRHRYPAFSTASDKNVFVVGIFGGSVAVWFSLQGEKVLEKLLSTLPAAQGKKVVILNFAQVSFKQPQQLLVLNFLDAIGQKIGLVIELDGVNETISADIQKEFGLDVAMPNFGQLARILTTYSIFGQSLENQVIIGQATKTQLKINKIKNFLNRRSFIGRSALINLGAVGYLRFLEWLLGGDLAKIQRSQNFGKTSPINLAEHSYQTRQEAVEEMANVWARCSLQMKALVEGGQGGRYFHFLQPVPQFGKHHFSYAEKRDALYHTYFNRLVLESYPVFLKKGEQLKKKGLKFFSLSEIFDGTSSVVYADVCHLNQRGNEILAEKIATLIKANYN